MPAVPRSGSTTRAEIAGTAGRAPTAGCPYTYPFNLTGQPAASVPCGFTQDGLPIGLQIVGRRFDDPTVLRAAAAFEQRAALGQRAPRLVAVAGGLFAAAVAIRLAALAILGLPPESFEYERQARSLLAGEGYRHVHLGMPHLAFGPPLFGFLCAGLYRVFGDGPLSVILAQIGASSLIPVVIARIAREVGVDRRLEWVAALPAVVHPGLVVYAVRKLHPLPLTPCCSA